jgi:SAM-dependent methyltransferase
MNDAARGYVLDEPYTARYFDIQSPARIGYSIRCAGFDHPEPRAGFRYAELGCGNGATLAMLAALHPTASFLGVDLNPVHIAQAQALARSAGLDNVAFIEADFARAAAMPWGPFDYVTAHGVYAWVDTAVREQMFAFIGRHLAADGTAYVSYNALPGWAGKEPLWRLLDRHIAGIPGNSLRRVDEGLRFLEFLRGAGAPYFAENPAAAAHLDYLRGEDPRYVAHEFCNRHFAPVYCEQAFADARRHGLVFVAQSETRPNLASERAPANCLGYLAGVPGFEDREVMASLMRNDAFRTDLYVRQLPETVEIERSPLWDRVFTTLVPTRDIGTELHCGSRTLARAEPIVDALLAGCVDGRLSLRQLAAGPGLVRHSPRAVLEIAQLLELSHCFGFLARSATARAADRRPWRLASPAFGVLLASRLRENGFGHLAAPQLGSAIRLGTLESLAVLCLQRQATEGAADELAASLNRDWPDLLAFRVDHDWAVRYLDDFVAGWEPVLRKLGTIVDA